MSAWRTSGATGCAGLQTNPMCLSSEAPWPHCSHSHPAPRSWPRPDSCGGACPNDRHNVRPPAIAIDPQVRAKRDPEQSSLPKDMETWASAVLAALDNLLELGQRVASESTVITLQLPDLDVPRGILPPEEDGDLLRGPARPQAPRGALQRPLAEGGK